MYVNVPWTDNNTTYSIATASSDGLMSNTMYSKLSGIEYGAQANTITGVKGESESSYRTGKINITKSNIGLGNVDNTADSDKKVSYANSAGTATSATSATTSSTCTGNAKTATSLATTRTIWGKSFNGSANISGDMTGVGNITLQGTTRTKDFGSDGNSIRTLYTRSISCDST